MSGRTGSRWVVPLLGGLGAVLAAVAVVIQQLSGGGEDLRASGTATTAVVRDVQGQTQATRRELLEYRHGETTFITAVRCTAGCHAEGEVATVWLDPDDPTHLATEWGDARRAAEENPLVWLPGLGGGMLIIAALVMVVNRRMSGATP